VIGTVRVAAVIVDRWGRSRDLGGDPRHRPMVGRRWISEQGLVHFMVLWGIPTLQQVQHVELYELKVGFYAATTSV
jgi:hypothetical protein